MNDVKRLLRSAEKSRVCAALRTLPNIRGRPIALQEQLEVAREATSCTSVHFPASIVLIHLTMGREVAQQENGQARFLKALEQRGGLSGVL